MILIFGKGQVAREIEAIDKTALLLGRDDANLLEPQACADLIRSMRPKFVINAAAYTSVERAEDEELTATLVNGSSPTAMAKACSDVGIPFVHISTDYVFNGLGSMPWNEYDAPSPICAYGRSKLQGDIGVQRNTSNYAILRTSWVFSAYGKNFVKNILNLSKFEDSLRVICDQIGGPTPAKDIAAACLKVAGELEYAPEKSGIYNLSGSPDVSWAEFASSILEEAGRSTVVQPTLTADYPSSAARPLNSRLNCSLIESTFEILRPEWALCLSETIKEIGFIDYGT
jgi:dTDP-4-dehydrorhamnose reductase